MKETEQEKQEDGEKDTRVTWNHVPVTIFHTDVVCCVGTRTQMMETGAKFFAESLGWAPSKVDEVGRKLAMTVPHEGEDEVCGEVFHVSTKYGRVCFIRLDSFELSDSAFAVLSHECLHVAISMMKDLGIVETGNRECLCYLHEYIFRELLNGMVKDRNPCARAEGKGKEE